MIVAGIDIGSVTTKAVLLSGDVVLGSRVIATGWNSAEAGRKVFEELLAELGFSSSGVERVVATGYGRNSLSFAHRTVTEILCHGAGVRFAYPHVRMVIDIGGQDSKVIALDEKGHVADFAMNDKCAAGTGRFLEVMARALEVDLEAFGSLSGRAERPSAISSICTVFAESEVISLLAKGEGRENIIAGIHDAVASRVSSLVHRVGLRKPLMMTGGVAMNGGVVKSLENRLKLTIEVAPTAQVNGAVGAAVIARDEGV